MEVRRRNAAVATIVFFVCVAVYLNWSYQSGETADTGKALGEAALTNGQISDPPVGGTAASPDSASSTSPEAGTTGDGSYFDSARLNRQQARDSALTTLQDSIASESADETMKEANGEVIQTLASYTVSEAQIGNLMTIKSYTDYAAFTGDESASVVVSTREGGLTDVDVTKTAEIAIDKIRMGTSQVKIIEAKGQMAPEHAGKNRL